MASDANDIPIDSARGRSLAAVEERVSPLGLRVTPVPSDRSTFSFRLSDERASLTVSVERTRPEGRYFQKAARLAIWYARDPSASEPQWTGGVLKALAQALLSRDDLADELSPRTTALPLAQSTAREVRPAPFPQYSVFDLVLRGVKPLGSLLVASEASVPEVARRLPHRLLSSFGFSRDSRDNLRFVATPEDGRDQRMFYAGNDAGGLQRLEQLERALYERRGDNPSELVAMQEEVGQLLGFPACCARAFAERAGGAAQRHGDLYDSLARPGWSGRSIDWRLNHIVAKQYALPLLTHEPCTPECAATAEWIDRCVAALYGPEERRLVTELLSLGAVMFPDDRVVLFRLDGPAQADGVRVSAFNQDPHLHVLGGARPPGRRIGRDAGGFPDAEVRALRLQDGRLEVAVGAGWHPYQPVGVSPVASPLLLVTSGSSQPVVHRASVA